MFQLRVYLRFIMKNRNEEKALASQLLSDAASRCEYGENYDRSLSDSCYWLRDALEQGRTLGPSIREVQAHLAAATVGELNGSSSWEAFYAINANVQRMESSLQAGDFRRLNESLEFAADLPADMAGVMAILREDT